MFVHGRLGRSEWRVLRQQRSGSCFENLGLRAETVGQRLCLRMARLLLLQWVFSLSLAISPSDVMFEVKPMLRQTHPASEHIVNVCAFAYERLMFVAMIAGKMCRKELSPLWLGGSLSQLTMVLEDDVSGTRGKSYQNTKILYMFVVSCNVFRENM